ncbi:MAG TPA: DinB family protein [Blastocatellia bacterium]|nr:DinB family protein [Blastocatellia bacterium]
MQSRNTHRDSPVRALITANHQILAQGRELLRQIDDELYTSLAPPLFEYGVGSHFRHCLDSYRCFFAGLTAGRIDYDQRERDELIARHRDCALARLEDTITQLQRLSSFDTSSPLQARQDSPHWSSTSLARELQFLLSHTVHHYALIALMLRVQGFAPGAEFGVAPSTLEYWKEEAGCVQ